MKEEESDKLEKEIIIGAQAEKVYEKYIKPFIEKKTALLFEAFKDVSITNIDDIVEIKRMIRVLESLEDEFITFINTGKMANKVVSDFIEKQEKDNARNTS